EAMYSPSLTTGSQQPPPPPPAAPQESTPTPQAPPPPSSPPPLPGVNGLTLVPRTFVAASAGPSIAVAPGTTVGYLAVAPATTTFRVEKPVAGRRSAGRCVKPTRR